jgi:hypothetical protein
MEGKKHKRRQLIVLLSLFVLSVSRVDALHAQTRVVWSEPILLSRRASLFTAPTVAADLWGGVHVFWTEETAEAGSPNLIMYTNWDGNDWTAPYDLFVGESWAGYGFPYAVADNVGGIHLIWASYNRLYYSTAPASSASDVRAWQTPQIVAETPRIQHSRIARDAQGVLHIVYTVRNPGANVMYTSSTDNGYTWSIPVGISKVFPNDPQVPTEVRLAIDSQNNLHVVWSESYPPEYLGRHVLYTQSRDGGVSWAYPVALSGSATEKDVNYHINLAIDGNNAVHVVWCGGPAGSNRLYRHSPDGGNTWSGDQLIFEGFVGWAGWDTMISDTYGNVYWAGFLRYPQAIYFSMIEDNAWADPPQMIIAEKPGIELVASGHFPQLIVAEGNQLHLVLVEGDSGGVWYMQGKTTYPGIAALPTPTIAPTATPTATPIPPTTTPIVAPDWNPETEASRLDNSNSLPIVFALLPSLLLVIVVVLKTRAHTRV